MSTSVPPPGFATPARPREPVAAPEPEPGRSLDRRWKFAGAGAAVAVIAVVAFLLLGSGGGGSALSGPVAQAAVVSSGTAGYRMRMSLEISSPSLSAPIVAHGSGVVDLRDKAMSMSMAMNFGQDPQVTAALGSSTMKLEMLFAGTTIYMKLPGAVAAHLPDASKPWVSLDLSKLSGIPGLSSLASNPTVSDPRQILGYLRSASDGVVDEGQQRVDGFETTHYRASISVAHLLGALPAADRAALQQALPGGELPIDVWIDSAHLVRRMVMSLALSSSTASAIQESVTVDFSDYGDQPRPTPPPAAQVQDLSGLASSLGG